MQMIPYLFVTNSSIQSYTQCFCVLSCTPKKGLRKNKTFLMCKFQPQADEVPPFSYSSKKRASEKNDAPGSVLEGNSSLCPAAVANSSSAWLRVRHATAD